MAKNVIIPKDYMENIPAPVIFLVGPMGGTAKWHDWAIDFIHSRDPGICVASPEPILSKKHLDNTLKGDMPDFERRLDWERNYLEVASMQGAILAWLPNETQHDCGKVYGRDTRGELGEWRGRLVYDSAIQIIIGGEPGFDGIEMIKRNFLAVYPDMKFYSTLEKTCAEAARRARLKYP